MFGITDKMKNPTDKLQVSNKLACAMHHGGASFTFTVSLLTVTYLTFDSTFVDKVS